MTSSRTASSAPSSAGRWILSLAGWGLIGGVAHAFVASIVTALIEAGPVAADLPGVLMVLTLIGGVVGVVLATGIGLLTAPAAVRAATRGRWGHLRPWVIALPTAALVGIGVAIEPPWPIEPVDPFVLSEFLVSLVWLYAGPACWAGVFLYRLTARWSH